MEELDKMIQHRLKVALVASIIATILFSLTFYVGSFDDEEFEQIEHVHISVPYKRFARLQSVTICLDQWKMVDDHVHKPIPDDIVWIVEKYLNKPKV